MADNNKEKDNLGRLKEIEGINSDEWEYIVKEMYDETDSNELILRIENESEKCG